MSGLYIWAVNHLPLLRACVLTLMGITTTLAVTFAVAEEKEKKHGQN